MFIIGSATAHADFSLFKQKKTTQNAKPSSQLFVKPNQTNQTSGQTTSPEPQISKEELEKRRTENEALSQQLGMNIPETFNQDILSASGAAPQSAQDLKVRQAIKRKKQAQALAQKRQKQRQKQNAAQQNFQKRNGVKVYKTPPKQKKIYRGTHKNGAKTYNFSR